MKRLIFSITLVIVLLFSTGPILWQALTSIKPEAQIAILPPLLPRSTTLDHYASVLGSGSLTKTIVNSGVVAVTSTALSLALGSLAAFGLAKLPMRFKRLVLFFVLSTSMFPPIATVSPLYLIIRSLGIRDTWWALIITYTSFSLPLSIWILTSFFDAIPDDIYRAARVDGCSHLQAFRKIMLPLAAPGLATAAILVFIYSWNEFLFALTFTVTPASRTVPVAIALFSGLHEVPWGEISAASLIATAPLIVLVLVFHKRIIEGLTAGAVKG
jgi:multiple sugar transport system permease protein